MKTETKGKERDRIRQKIVMLNVQECLSFFLLDPSLSIFNLSFIIHHPYEYEKHYKSQCGRRVKS